jgi:hypothetical protein
MRPKVAFLCAAFAAAFSLTAFGNVCATAASAAPAALAAAVSNQQAAAPNAADSQNFAGKIVSQNGVRYILRDEQGNTWYHLDDQQQARKFLGKLVNVTGTLDGQTDTIHVSTIAESKT